MIGCEKFDKVIKGISGAINDEIDEPSYPYFEESRIDTGLTREVSVALLTDALDLLKAHETATVEPKRIDLADETKAWLDKMDAVDALGNIANICVDWDGYRTADGLGGLINEIWAYARYCADRLLKAQEPRVMTLGQVRDEADHMYIEKHSKTGSDLYGCAIRGDWDGYGIELLMSEYDTARERWSDYGKTWRCWTSRPTYAQREAIPWN